MFKSLKFNRKTLTIPLSAFFILMILIGFLTWFVNRNAHDKSLSILDQEVNSIQSDFDDKLSHFYGVLYSA